jgi:hypothetical protein
VYGLLPCLLFWSSISSLLLSLPVNIFYPLLLLWSSLPKLSLSFKSDRAQPLLCLLSSPFYYSFLSWLLITVHIQTHLTIPQLQFFSPCSQFYNFTMPQP